MAGQTIVEHEVVSQQSPMSEKHDDDQILQVSQMASLFDERDDHIQSHSGRSRGVR